MTTWMIIFGAACFVGGGALIWFCKDPVTKWYKGAEDFVGEVGDQARSLKDRLK